MPSDIIGRQDFTAQCGGRRLHLQRPRCRGLVTTHDSYSGRSAKMYFETYLIEYEQYCSIASTSPDENEDARSRKKG